MNKEQRDFLIKLKNFSIANKEAVPVKYSVKTLNLIKFLYAEGLILCFFVINDIINVIIPNYSKENQISNLKIPLKSSYKKNIKYRNLTLLPVGKQVLCVTTSSGFLNLNNCKKNRVGGSVLLIT